MNGQWNKNGFPGATREKRCERKDLGNQLTPAFSSTNIYDFPPLWEEL